MDPFFAHYQDQDWKKRDREGTFRERCARSHTVKKRKKKKSRHTQSPKQQADKDKPRWHDGNKAPSLNIHFLISAAGGDGADNERRHTRVTFEEDSELNRSYRSMQSCQMEN